MVNKFFEGKDFDNKFKALIPKYYPSEYKKYIEEERKLIINKVSRANIVLEAGVGIGRIIPFIASKINLFVGIDNASFMLDESKKIAKKYKNVKIRKLDIEDISKNYSKDYFDYSLCIWNTIGNVKNEVKVLSELSKVTSKEIIITVYKKGTLKQRMKWYETVGIDIKKIDKKNEIFYSKSGLKSKSYNLEDIKNIAEKANLKIKDHKILSNVILYVELERK
jgi:hypothetical protein